MKHSVFIIFRREALVGEFKSHGYDHYGNAVDRRNRKIEELLALGYEIVAFTITSLRAA